MKEIRFRDHAKLKREVLASHEVSIDSEFVIEAVRSPDKLETGGNDKLIAQKRLDEILVLRVVYREFSAFILIITLYPGRRSRYEKISYSKDVDALLIELSDEPIAYAEDEEQVILH